MWRQIERKSKATPNLHANSNEDVSLVRSAFLYSRNMSVSVFQTLFQGAISFDLMN